MTAESYKVAAAALFALAARAAPLAAQQPARDSLTRDSLRLYPLPTVVVTASRAPAAVGTAGLAVAVLRRGDLPAEAAPSAARTLAWLTSVSIEEGAGPGGPAVLRLRGGGEPFTQMLFDGVPVNISGGFNDLAGVLLTNVERVEVARGPLSALWGSSAAAGAVQFLTREGTIGPTRLAVTAEGGRAGSRGDVGRTELTIGGGTARLRYSGGVGVAYQQGVYALPHDALTRDASLRVDAQLAPRWTLTATTRFMAIRSHLPVRDPGVSRAPLDPNQRDGRTRWLGSVSAGWQAAPAWHHRLTASLLHDRFTYEDERDSIPGTYPFFLFNFDFSFRSTLVRPGVEYVGSYAPARGPAPAPVSVSYGARWQRETEVNVQGGEFGPSRTRFPRSNAALFAEVQGRAGPRVSGLAGLRLEDFQGLAAQLLPRASLSVDLVPDRLALRGAAGRAFKAPNVDQQYLDNPSTVPNPALRPEASRSAEIGLRLTEPRRAVMLEVTYFRQRYDDLIATVAADTGTRQTNKNVGSTRSSGVEVEAERRWSARLRGGASLAWVHTEILDNTGLDTAAYPVGGAMPAVPRYTGGAWLAAELAPAVSAFLRVTAAGRQTVFTERFSGARVETDSYALVEVSAEWRVSARLAAYARIGNLLNADYQTAFDRPGLPRTGIVGVRAGT